MKKFISLLCIVTMIMVASFAGFVWADEEDSSIAVQRVGGANRYETSFAVAEALKPEAGAFDNVVIASGRNFPDALSGAYLARAAKATLILETPGYDDQIIQLIKKHMNPGGKVFILGGASAVGEAFEEKAKAAGLNTERFFGPDRYATNQEILRALFGVSAADDKEGTSKPIGGERPTELVVASGETYADALSGSALGRPMLLVGKSLTNSQIDFLKATPISRVYILGGPSAVNKSIENTIKSIDSNLKVERVAGINRFDTSRKIASKFFPNATAVTLASGLSFPDGLSGSTLAMASNSPILLVSKDDTSYARSFAATHHLSKEIIIGGGSAVSDKVAKKVIEKPEGETPHVHVWSTSFKWNSDLTSAEAIFKCIDCEETKTEDADIRFHVSKAATYYETGTMTCTASAKDPDGRTKTSIRTKSLPKTYANHSYHWNEERYNSGSRVLYCKATAYVAGGYGASGKPAVPGTVAVDRSVIPLGTKLYIEGYGYATANDTGGAIRGNFVDLVYNDYYTCIHWGVRYVNVYILD